MLCRHLTKCGGRTLNCLAPQLNHSIQCRPLLSKLTSRPGVTLFASTSDVSTSQIAEDAASTQTQASESQDHIYSHPELYEAAFSFRNFKEEVQFLQDAYKRHTGGKPLTSVLELGCGPATHSIRLAQQGVQRVVALDISDDMLAYARKKAVAAASGGSSKKGAASGKAPQQGASKAAAKGAGKGFAPTAAAAPDATASSSAGAIPEGLELVKADMTNFDLPGPQFDMVMCLLGTFSHMTDNAQALSSFRAATRHLRPGGLLLLELAHPGDLFDGTLIIGDGGKEVWEVPKGKERKILVEWGAEFDNFDPITQILYRTVSINVLKGDDVEQSLEEVVPYRQYTVQEIDLLATMCGLKLEQLYGEMSLEVDMVHEEAYRMIAVLSKPEA